MHICLIRPPGLVNFGSFAINQSPPLGLAFIAGALRNAGHKVTIIDAIGEGPDHLAPIDFPLLTGNPLPNEVVPCLSGLPHGQIVDRVPKSTDLIGISCMFAKNWPADRHLIDLLGKRLPDIPIVAGGENITAMPKLGIEQTRSLTAVVMGEGEETIVELADALAKGRDLSEIQGIVYRKGEEVKTNPRRARLKNLEAIPLPDWDGFPLDMYKQHMMRWGFTESPSLPVMATRGCPFSCTFCSSPQMWGTRYYMRSPAHVADELEALNRRYGISDFDFYDLTAIIKREWIIEFSKEIVRRKMDIRWFIPAGTRSEAIDSEVALHLFRSGCRSITYAPESGSDRLLRLIKKKVNLDNMLQSMSHAHKQGMHVFINVIIALPDENFRDILHTLWFMIRCSWAGVDEVGIARFWPYPGSELFDRLLQEGKLNLTTDDFFLNMMLLTSHERADYYNESMPQWWYRGYMPLILAVFYGSNFLFRPLRMWRAVRNVMLVRPGNRTERAFLDLLRNKVKRWRSATLTAKTPRTTT